MTPSGTGAALTRSSPSGSSFISAPSTTARLCGSMAVRWPVTRGATRRSARTSRAVLRPLDNELVVRADDPATDLTIPRGKQLWREKPEGIFYTPTTGIWQTVWVEPLPHDHVASLRLWPRLDGGILEFEITASQPRGVVELDARLGERHLGRWSGAAGRGRLFLTQVAPWSPDSPVLYDLVVRLVDDAGREMDRVTSYFGLRTVATRDGRFLLNGEPFVQRLVLDQGYFPGGWYTAARMPSCAGTLSSRSRSGSTARVSTRRSKILAGCTGPIGLVSWCGARCPTSTRTLSGRSNACSTNSLPPSTATRITPAWWRG